MQSGVMRVIYLQNHILIRQLCNLTGYYLLNRTVSPSRSFLCEQYLFIASCKSCKSLFSSISKKYSSTHFGIEFFFHLVKALSDISIFSAKDLFVKPYMANFSLNSSYVIFSPIFELYNKMRKKTIFNNINRNISYFAIDINKNIYYNSLYKSYLLRFCFSVKDTKK